MDKARDHPQTSGSEFTKDKQVSRPSSVMSNKSNSTQDVWEYFSYMNWTIIIYNIFSAFHDQQQYQPKYILQETDVLSFGRSWTLDRQNLGDEIIKLFARFAYYKIYKLLLQCFFCMRQFFFPFFYCKIILKVKQEHIQYCFKLSHFDPCWNKLLVQLNVQIIPST